MIMHDTKMFCLPTDMALRWVLGFLLYFSFGNPTHWTEVGRRRRKGGVTGQEVWPDESAVASESVGRSLRARVAVGEGEGDHPHHIHPIQHVLS